MRNMHCYAFSSKKFSRKKLWFFKKPHTFLWPHFFKGHRKVRVFLKNLHSEKKNKKFVLRGTSVSICDSLASNPAAVRHSLGTHRTEGLFNNFNFAKPIRQRRESNQRRLGSSDILRADAFRIGYGDIWERSTKFLYIQNIFFYV